MLPVRLFQGYREQPDARFAAFQLAVKSRSAAAPAHVLAARLRVQLRPGLVRRVMYALRPWPLLAILIGVAALSAAAGGSLLAAACLGTLLWTLRSPGPPMAGLQGNGSISATDDSVGDLSPGSSSIDDEFDDDVEGEEDKGWEARGQQAGTQPPGASVEQRERASPAAALRRRAAASAPAFGTAPQPTRNGSTSGTAHPPSSAQLHTRAGGGAA